MNLVDKMQQYLSDAGTYAAGAAVEAVRQDLNRDLSGPGQKVQAGIISGQLSDLFRNPVVWMLAIVVVIILVMRRR